MTIRKLVGVSSFTNKVAVLNCSRPMSAKLKENKEYKSSNCSTYFSPPEVTVFYCRSLKRILYMYMIVHLCNITKI